MTLVKVFLQAVHSQGPYTQRVFQTPNKHYVTLEAKRNAAGSVRVLIAVLALK